MQTWKIFTDGGSRGNPGESACAFVVSTADGEIFSQGKYLGIGTNNEAEYAGLLASLTWVVQQDLSDVQKIEWFTDSQLMRSQVTRLWKIKEPRMRQLVDQVWKLQTELQKQKKDFFITYVPREENKAADLLVNQTLDAHLA